MKAANKVNPSIPFQSLLSVAVADHRPKPGQLKIDSVNTAPLSKPPNDSPITVVVGIRALRRACFLITNLSGKPLDRAVLT
jgi:hypothetical protein